MSHPLFEEINNFTPKKVGNHADKYDRKNRESIFDQGVSSYKWHLFIYLFLVILVYVVFLGRSIDIQISHRTKYLGLAEQNRIREFSVLPPRGAIYDKDGEVIVRNRPSFSLELNTLICRKENSYDYCPQTLEEVKKHINLEDEEKVKSVLDQNQTNILLATGLSKEDILPLEANLEKMPGVSIETAPSRDYIYKQSFAHLIGYVGLGDTLTPSVVGKTGVEEYYDQYLSGAPGSKIVQVNSAGTSYQLITYKDSVPGKDAVLHADAKLQDQAYQLLEKAVEESESNATGGAIIAQDPRNGGVLTMVSYPTFDPDLLSSGISRDQLAALSSDPRFPFFNRVISGAYPPGSTFKMITASAALAEGVVTEYTSIFDPGYIQVGSYIFRNWLTSGHGDVNMVRAIQVSNDTYFYTVTGGYGGIEGLGIRRLNDWAEHFGLGSKTGIDLNGEISGYMPDGTAREWYLGDDYISGIGQGDILTTPLQINNVATYFANGGVLYRPKVVKSIEGIGENKPEIMAKDLLNKDAYDLVRKGLNAAVESGGTGYPLFDFSIRHDGIRLAGKTGTSEYISPQGEEKTHAWFTVFGPYYEDLERQEKLTEYDKPIVLTVFLEGGGSGSDDAAPIAKELLDFWFNED